MTRLLIYYLVSCGQTIFVMVGKRFGVSGMLSKSLTGSWETCIEPPVYTSQVLPVTMILEHLR